MITKAPVGTTEEQTLAERQAKMAALTGAVVRSRDGQLCIVVRPYAPDCANLHRLVDGRTLISEVGFSAPIARGFLCPVFWRHESGVQFVALVTRLTDTMVVRQLDLTVLGDGLVDLGAGPGVPVEKLDVPAGDAHECWQSNLDPWVDETVPE